MLETVTSFILVFSIYLLGSLAITQDYIKPEKSKDLKPFYAKILALSIVFALLPTILFYVTLIS
ncbi:hypothetical protein [Algoriphagus sediminis]|uniref:Uncharacterized protein n=1 Tax=Algoriphagus sediminis TaxID=3057113 RepID=A0ABT7YGX3_9BACT|nr:hypothetical protein [Algoriphagus sediminis]MDN3205767.1 hypothetical protein [Algoriphagus sediminis]